MKKGKSTPKDDRPSTACRRMKTELRMCVRACPAACLCVRAGNPCTIPPNEWQNRGCGDGDVSKGDTNSHARKEYKGAQRKCVCANYCLYIRDAARHNAYTYNKNYTCSAPLDSGKHKAVEGRGRKAMTRWMGGGTRPSLPYNCRVPASRLQP